MGLWMLLLLHLHLATGVSLSAPSSVSISSINLEHTLSFQPGPQTPSDARFMVEVVRSRKQSWKPVPACVALRAGQTCDLTRAFKDPFDHYVARVQAFTATQRSSWTVSDSFLPLSDTVIGPPDMAVSGCGNCLILHLTLPEVLASEHLKDSHTDLVFHVRRTRDGAERLPIPSSHLPVFEETLSFKSRGPHALMKAHGPCLKTERGTWFQSEHFLSVYMLVVLLGAFCALVFLLMALVAYGSRLTFSVLKTRLPKSLLVSACTRDQSCCD
ncbi:interferon alpha/beta receptor 2-like [Neolamprologus brichardi]|uniref:interferon alpha/beta receptor 2-like n=1 Tax=Neolamprologus brichardi TaxID=32507 RepID=UPI001643B2B4|nr:interferon alpha/beta receptor 2-like [Neolamprologus brichardi]